MSIAIQLSEAPERDPSATEYRQGFQRYVSSVLERDTEVILAEIHPYRFTELRSLWANHPKARLEQSRICWSESRELIAFWSPSATAEFPVSYSVRASRRYSPNSPIEQLAIRELDWRAWLSELGVASGSTIDLLSADLDETHLATDIDLLTRIPGVIKLSIGVTNLTAASRREADKQLRSAGFRRAGRLWGAAGTNQAYSRESGALARLAMAQAQARIRGGEVINDARVAKNAWDQTRRRAEANSENRRIDSHFDLRIDPAPGFPLPPVPRVEVAELARQVEQLSAVGTIDPWPIEISPLVVSDECYRIHGIRPISFSFPGEISNSHDHPREPLSPIVPGYPYSFTDHEAYMRAYQGAQLGITHRKAGWDCFRHVEILASGAIPLMVDAEEIPRYTMVHYPKAAMVELARLVSLDGQLPDPAAHRNFADYFADHLTSLSMARYLLESSGLAEAQRVLFVDENLPHTADYQSALTLIGLKQLLGSRCEVAFPVDWIYSDSQFDTSTLYGRGFGYTRVLPSNVRSKSESQMTSGIDFTALGRFDALVVGSISQNSALANRLTQEFPPAKSIWIHGEDRPPTVSEMGSYVDSGTRLFVRSIDC